MEHTPSAKMKCHKLTLTSISSVSEDQTDKMSELELSFYSCEAHSTELFTLLNTLLADHPIKKLDLFLDSDHGLFYFENFSKFNIFKNLTHAFELRQNLQYEVSPHVGPPSCFYAENESTHRKSTDSSELRRLLLPIHLTNTTNSAHCIARISQKSPNPARTRLLCHSAPAFVVVSIAMPSRLAELAASSCRFHNHKVTQSSEGKDTLLELPMKSYDSNALPTSTMLRIAVLDANLRHSRRIKCRKSSHSSSSDVHKTPEIEATVDKEENSTPRISFQNQLSSTYFEQALSLQQEKSLTHSSSQNSNFESCTLDPSGSHEPPHTGLQLLPLAATLHRDLSLLD
jgi:hypothetical protein